VRVDNEIVPIIIGKKGATITKLEEKLGVKLDVEPLAPSSSGKEVRYEIKEVGNRIDLIFEDDLTGEVANVYVGDQYLFSATVGKKSQIRVSKKSDLGRSLLRGLVSKQRIRVLI
jgi:ATPase